MTIHDKSAPSSIVAPGSGPVPKGPAEQSEEAVAPPSAPPIRLACVEVCNFRRLAKTRLDFDEATTILVAEKGTDLFD